MPFRPKISFFFSTLAIIITLGLFSFSPAFAQVSISNTLGATFGLSTTSLYSTIINIVNALLAFTGLIALTFILYGGFLWMTSAGRVERIEKAKKIIISALIGLLIILLSFAIVRFVMMKIGGGGGVGYGDGGGGNSSGNGALGGGIIESVYPAPGQLDVPRNTMIIVTFKEEMDASSIIEDTNGSGTLGDWVDSNGNGQLDSGEYDKILIISSEPVVKIAKKDELMTGPYLTDVFVSKTSDNKTFVFDPVPLLGSNAEKIWYGVELTNNIKKATGETAFGGLGKFDWYFEISTYVDITPPYIVNVFPEDGGTYPKNVIVQIQFSEAINPLSAVDSNIVFSNGGAPISGILSISNQYRTVEFWGSACGTNSCNETVYCLPGGVTINALIKAASLGGEPPAASGAPYDGVVDMAGNSLDGNHDGVAQGSGADDYAWSFNTTNKFKNTAPVIDSISPNIGDKGIGLRDPVEIVFREKMMHSSLRASNIYIKRPVVDFWITAEDLTLPPPVKTKVYINHSRFPVATDCTPEVNQSVKDIYQNCFFPSEGPNGSGGDCGTTKTQPYCCEGSPSSCDCDDPNAPCP